MGNWVHCGLGGFNSHLSITDWISVLYYNLHRLTLQKLFYRYMNYKSVESESYSSHWTVYLDSPKLLPDNKKLVII